MKEVSFHTSLCFPFPLVLGDLLALTAAVSGASWCCHLPQQEQERTVVSQCQAVLESAPRKVQSCLEEQDAIRQRVDEALRAKDQVRGQLLWDGGSLRCPHALGEASCISTHFWG